MDKEELIEIAQRAKEHAYAPYSGFRVGAAIALKDGKVITGANVENAAYGLCMCAERSAVFSAYSQGYRKEDIEGIALASDGAAVVTPCGACRQVLSELLDGNAWIVMTGKGKKKEAKVKDLLPFAFGMESLEKEDEGGDTP